MRTERLILGVALLDLGLVGLGVRNSLEIRSLRQQKAQLYASLATTGVPVEVKIVQVNQRVDQLLSHCAALQPVYDRSVDNLIAH